MPAASAAPPVLRVIDFAVKSRDECPDIREARAYLPYAKHDVGCSGFGPARISVPENRMPFFVRNGNDTPLNDSVSRSRVTG
jgi:hypothetical protein